MVLDSAAKRWQSLLSYMGSTTRQVAHIIQSSGQAERAVRTVKQLLEHSADPYMALLSYRATPLLFCELSPAELLMGCHIRTDIPQATDLFVPEWSYLDQLNQEFIIKEERRVSNSHNTLYKCTAQSSRRKLSGFLVLY